MPCPRGTEERPPQHRSLWKQLQSYSGHSGSEVQRALTMYSCPTGGRTQSGKTRKVPHLCEDLLAQAITSVPMGKQFQSGLWLWE